MSSSDSPLVIMLAGPNGAGKTTTANSLLQQLGGAVEYVNADVIAQGISATEPESVAWQAGEIMLRRLRLLAQKRVSFAFETTGASRTYAKWLRDLKQNGFKVHVYFFWLSSADLAIARVAERVRRGGHFVPDDVVRRRYELGLSNFFQLFQRVADDWALINNEASPSRPIASAKSTTPMVIHDAILWKSLTARYSTKDAS